MSRWASALRTLVVVALAGCSSQPSEGRLVVAITVDWEGAYLSPEGLQAITSLRAQLADPPITHFISAAYFTKESPDPELVTRIAGAVGEADEIAMHIHAWRSLARASGIEPKISPSFLTGTDELLELEDGDVGFDTDVDVYSVPELRTMLRRSRGLLEALGRPVSHAFRAAGYLGTPKMLRAACEEGYRIDSSAFDHRQLDRAVLAERVRELWPAIEPLSQPHAIELPGCQLIELPIHAVADVTQPSALVTLFEQASARLAASPDRDVFVVVAFTHETMITPSVLADAIARVRTRGDLDERLRFTTITEAARRARRASL